MKIFLAYFLLLTFGCVTYVQEIKGKVIDVNGMPLPGANVVVKGKNISTSTDFDGLFSLKADTND